MDKVLGLNLLGTEEIKTREIKAPRSVVDSRLNLYEVMEDVLQASKVFEGTCLSTSTLRSYRIGLAHWSAWLQLRYTRGLTDGPLPEEIAFQFVLDHLGRPTEDGNFEHQLPQVVDQLLVTSGIKAGLGALSHSTVKHRLNVLSSWLTFVQNSNADSMPMSFSPIKLPELTTSRIRIALKIRAAYRIQKSSG